MRYAPAIFLFPLVALSQWRPAGQSVPVPFPTNGNTAYPYLRQPRPFGPNAYGDHYPFTISDFVAGAPVFRATPADLTNRVNPHWRVEGMIGYAASTTTHYKLGSDGVTWTPLLSGGGGSTIQVDIFTNSGNWSRPAGFVAGFVRVVGGGGGGGGSSVVLAPTNTPPGGGGEAGAVSEAWLLSVDANVAVTVGAGGAPGTAPTAPGTGTAGVAGGNSQFGLYLFAAGGAPGTVTAAGTGTASLYGNSGSGGYTNSPNGGVSGAGPSGGGVGAWVTNYVTNTLANRRLP